MPLISIVVPCYNEQESLPIFLKELDGVVRIMTRQDPGISFEAVLIDAVSFLFQDFFCQIQRESIRIIQHKCICSGKYFLAFSFHFFFHTV